MAIATQDPEGLERALAAREALRPRIETITGEIQRRGGASLAALDAVRNLGAEAATAEAQLAALLEAERSRLRHEIDSLRRGTDSAAGYRRPDAPNPHRLNIVR